MDPLLLPLLEATEAAQQHHQIIALTLTQAAPLTRKMMRKWLNFQINADGYDPYWQEAADLYQDILAKVLQTLNDRLEQGTLTEIANFRQYVMRIATNACRDFQRQQSPVRARFKNFLHYLLQTNPSFAVWRHEHETLCGFAGWGGGSKSTLAGRRLAEIGENPNLLKLKLPAPGNYKQENLGRVLAGALAHVGGPVALDELVVALASILQLKEISADSLTDPTANWAEQLPDKEIRCDERAEEREIFHRLWSALCQLPPLQRDSFCFSIADHNGEDLLTLLFYAGNLSLTDLAQGLGRTEEELRNLWERMPLDNKEIAELLQATSPQVNKWRFRAVEKLRRTLAAQ